MLENILNNNQLLLENVKSHSKKVGRIAAKPVLTLFYVLKSEETPISDKILISAAISYLVLPIDLIPKNKIPILGSMDELAAIAFAYNAVKKHITNNIEIQVDNTLDNWFSDNQ